MSSGVKADAEVANIANSFKNGEARKKYAFLTFKISDDKKSVIFSEEESLTQAACGMDEIPDKTEAEHCRWKAFHVQLKGDTPRWYIYDCFQVLDSDSSRQVQKQVFIHWCPDTVGVKHKMLYAASKDAFKSATNAGTSGKFIECSDFDECTHEILLEKTK